MSWVVNSLGNARNPIRRNTGRCRVVNRNIRDENNKVLLIRGFNQGHGEVTNEGDPGEDIALGANTVRIIWRVWGPYETVGGTTLNGQQIGAPGGLIASYMAGIVLRVRQAKNAGLKVILAGDSNCGQNGAQGYPDDLTTYNFCTVAGTPGSNFMTASGAAQRAQFYATWRWLARRLYGLVDFYEPLVEPSFPGSSQAETSVLQDEIRTIILKEDPFAIFFIGGYPGYQVPYAEGAYQAKWAADSNTVLTFDMLDGAVSAPATFPGKVTTVCQARANTGCPIMCNQLGSTLQSDPDNAFLISAAAQLRDASGGSIGWTFWEKVSAGANSYGPYRDNGTVGRSLTNPARLAVMSTLFKDSKVAAS